MYKYYTHTYTFKFLFYLTDNFFFENSMLYKLLINQSSSNFIIFSIIPCHKLLEIIEIHLHTIRFLSIEIHNYHIQISIENTNICVTC